MFELFSNENEIYIIRERKSFIDWSDVLIWISIWTPVLNWCKDRKHRLTVEWIAQSNFWIIPQTIESSSKLPTICSFVREAFIPTLFFFHAIYANLFGLRFTHWSILSQILRYRPKHLIISLGFRRDLSPRYMTCQTEISLPCSNIIKRFICQNTRSRTICRLDIWVCHDFGNRFCSF